MKKAAKTTKERAPICGICITPFIKISEYEWIGVCEHRAGVVSRTGAKIKKIRKIKTNGSKEVGGNEEREVKSEEGGGESSVGSDEEVKKNDEEIQ